MFSGFFWAVIGSNGLPIVAAWECFGQLRWELAVHCPFEYHVLLMHSSVRPWVVLRSWVSLSAARHFLPYLHNVPYGWQRQGWLETAICTNNWLHKFSFGCFRRWLRKVLERCCSSQQAVKEYNAATLSMLGTFQWDTKTNQTNSHLLLINCHTKFHRCKDHLL